MRDPKNMQDLTGLFLNGAMIGGEMDIRKAKVCLSAFEGARFGLLKTGDQTIVCDDDGQPMDGFAYTRWNGEGQYLHFEPKQSL